MTRTIVIECKSCAGTGLVKGLYPRDGVAFVCKECDGTGKIEFNYNEFEGRKEMDGVIRVFDSVEHYVHYAEDTEVGEDIIHLDSGLILHFSQFGCSYTDWKNGITPKPMEELYCPKEYCGEAPCERCDHRRRGYRITSNCEFYPDKEKCWDEWHKNND